MDAKLEYCLKQETPMIHFQYEEAGATLRASELKPKLDRFIKRKMGKIPDNWKLRGESSNSGNESLDYKVKIIASGKPIVSGTINSMYFGNMGGAGHKKTIFYQEDQEIKLEILCFIPKLRKCIDDNIVEFFLTTNFGTRQSKGFGGFTVTRDANPIEKLEAGQYCFFYCKADGMSVDEKLKIAQAVYALMKGGYRKAGIEGFIQNQYWENSDASGEKDYIINYILQNKELNPSKQKKEEIANKWKFRRALLGLSGRYVFLKNNTIDRNKTVIVKHKWIKRFQSPILIKIVDEYVIFLMTDSYKAICNQSFGFENNKNKFPELKVPDNFDGEDFMEKFVEYFNKTKEKILEQEKKEDVKENKKEKNTQEKKDMEVELLEMLKNISLEKRGAVCNTQESQ